MILSELFTEVRDNVFDDERNTAYIRLITISGIGQDEAVARIMIEKKDWEIMFSNKRIVAMSTVSDAGNLCGLLIHYEQR